MLQVVQGDKDLLHLPIISVPKEMASGLGEILHFPPLLLDYLQNMETILPIPVKQMEK